MLALCVLTYADVCMLTYGGNALFATERIGIFNKMSPGVPSLRYASYADVC
jgi:hypothetical protein